uniref:Putative salivary kunitz domain protein n=1 Tax=Ixodes ricinus TaxID=34613 RepID=A0A6B0USW1_IXORI
MQKILQFICVVSFVILACRASSEEDLPERCFQPAEDPRCRANGRRYFLDEDEKRCKLHHGCWGAGDGYYDEGDCRRHCEDLPERCFQPEQDPRCRANGRRHFLDEGGKRCKLYHGCWGANDGYYDEADCKRHCEVGKN